MLTAPRRHCPVSPPNAGKRTLRVAPGWMRGLRLAGGLCLTLLLATASHGQSRLPSMGEPADEALSPRQEQRLGADFMRQIRASLPLVNDVQVEEYIQSLGMRLVLASGRTEQTDYTFFVIDESTINAFAIPGGYVGVNAGLIAAMTREEQLASVLAHEIAHVTQRHHARSYATGNRQSLSAAATVIAAILIGQASPEAGQAALAAGLAATQQSAINFTRSNEIEADRIGIEILGNAQFDTAAMAETFDILRRRNALNTSAGALEYLRTHPLDNNRIAEARDRAADTRRPAAVPPVDFDLFQAHVIALTTRDSSQLQRSYQARLAHGEQAASLYGLALLNHLDNRPERATGYLDRLDKVAPAHPMGQLLRAEVLESRGRVRESLALLRELHAIYPDRYSIVQQLIDTLVQARKFGEATQLTNRYLRSDDQPNPLAWRQLAGIQQQLGDSAASHESLARYFSGIDELALAADQIELALRLVPTASQDELRLQASLKDLTARMQGRL